MIADILRLSSVRAIKTRAQRDHQMAGLSRQA
jgi:hypothetical protein